MARYTGPVDRLSRREGRDLKLKGERYRKGKSPLQKRPFPPGQGSAPRRGKESTFALMLREKQALKRIYGMLERQFRLYFQKADRYRGKTGEVLLQLLESRLDNVVYRAGFATTRAAARQLVTHGHVRVDGRKVDRPSFQVKPGMQISLKEKSREVRDVQAALELADKSGRMSYIEYDVNSGAARMLSVPKREDISDLDIREQLIVEFYSR